MALTTGVADISAERLAVAEAGAVWVVSADIVCLAE